MPLVPVLPGLYSTAVARLLRGLALAGQARSADADQRDSLLSELDDVTRWLAERAADAPDNFLHLLLWSKDRHGWLRPAPDADGGTVPVSRTGHESEVPTSVLRYARRTREPLVVADAARDDRFARDPYFAALTCCSVLAVPVLSRGALRAVLLLENRLLGGAFTAPRLDAVNLIAGQLAASLDNAQLYAEVGRIAGEQAALRRVATMVARAAAPAEVFAAVTEEAGRLLRADHAWMARYDPDGARTMVASWSSTGADAGRGSGLTGLRDRVEAVGGRMTLDSPAGAGTVLTVLLPVPADDH
ncbi:MAG: GAF domain-containing protein [Streptosporangiaceae bacterium]